MPGRRAKPLSLHLAEGNQSHLTKKEIEERAAGEVRLGAEDDLKMPAQVRACPAARKAWRDIAALHRDSGLGLLTSSDARALARYCLTHSEYLDLVERRRVLAEIEITISGTEGLPEDVQEQLEDLLRLDPLARIDGLINKKLAALLALEDRLFLNPLAKVKNIIKQSKQPAADPLDEAGFGNV